MSMTNVTVKIYERDGRVCTYRYVTRVCFDNSEVVFYSVDGKAARRRSMDDIVNVIIETE